MTQAPLRSSLLNLVHLNRCRALSLVSTNRKCIAHRKSLSRPLVASRYVTTSSTNHNQDDRVLGRSTLLFQDGLDINEMPIVVRRIGKNDNILKNETDTDAELVSVSAQDSEFKERLLLCGTVKDVFALLDVTDDRVTSHSAAFALQRLCRVQKGSKADIDTFISKAILNELCETTLRHVKTFSNSVIIDLVRCYTSSSQKSYPEKFISRINNVLETRIGENLFKVTEVFDLLELLSTYQHSDKELVSNLWIHLGNRYKELNEANIARAYDVTKFMPSKTRYGRYFERHLIKFMNAQLSDCWWKLNIRDAVSISQSLMSIPRQPGAMGSLGKWIYVNLHDVRADHMRHFMTLFIHFSMYDANLLRALERYYVTKRGALDASTVAMGMEYCRRVRHLAPRMFDLAAAHFAQNSAQYSPLEAFFTLRPIGQLNHVPENASQLFSVVESNMKNWFNHMNPAWLIELLVSFVYIKRYPRNFVHDIFNQTFFEKIQGCANFSHIEGKQSIALDLSMLIQSYKIDEGMRHGRLLLDRKVVQFTPRFVGSESYGYGHNDCHHYVVDHVMNALEAMGVNQFYRKKYVGVSYHIGDFFIHFLLHVNMDRRIIPPIEKVRVGPETKSIAILLGGQEDYCANTKHPTGEFATKIRHLEATDFNVIVVDTTEHTSVKLCTELLRQQLSPHVNFTKTGYVTTGAPSPPVPRRRRPDLLTRLRETKTSQNLEPILRASLDQEEEYILREGVTTWGEGAISRGEGVTSWGEGASGWGEGARILGEGAPGIGDGAFIREDGVTSWGDGATSWDEGVSPLKDDLIGWPRHLD